jgi:hypothetical protein
MRRIILISVLACGIGMVARTPAHAQTQWEIDRVLGSLEGVWTGTVTLPDGPHACEWTWSWMLDNAYLGGTAKVYRGKATSNGVYVEAQEFLKPSGESRYSINRFSSDGVSTWGAIEVAGKVWTFDLKNSDGGEEHGELRWESDASVIIVSRVTDGSGEELRQSTTRLTRRR